MTSDATLRNQKKCTNTTSLHPFLYDYELERPRRLLDQHFGLGFTPDDILSGVADPVANREYYRPWRQLAAAARDLGSSIKSDKEKFQINLDVHHFAPEEISEKKDQHGYISRQFTRRYTLPDGCVPENVESKLSSDGVLSVIAPRKAPQAVQSEHQVSIMQTGPKKEVSYQAIGDKAQ
ncbi:unnamed protein product [Leptidea sinapis]|uniref:SHSP domain-containing protein n=1 Tax=Leptidea sinapis TaxID=189913 RepID=A0A5E4R3M5_9NEOP|nr:unnamed protein product [Leptidea sinapis]